jgi:hypothetical protein
LAQGEWTLTLPEDSVQRLGDAVWRAEEPGDYELRAEVRSGTGPVISENVFRFSVAR